MTDTAPQFGVTHPTVIPVNHRQRCDFDGQDEDARPDGGGGT